MRHTLALLGLSALAFADPIPQAVTAVIPAPGPAPSGCVPSFAGNFLITVETAAPNAKRAVEKRQVENCPSGDLTLSLEDGILKDNFFRIGYIASNRQFQFDLPPQAGAIYTAGFSVCSNGTLAIGSDTIFYSCKSGAFSNLYDQSVGGQCLPANIQITPCVFTGTSHTAELQTPGVTPPPQAVTPIGPETAPATVSATSVFTGTPSVSTSVSTSVSGSSSSTISSSLSSNSTATALTSSASAKTTSSSGSSSVSSVSGTPSVSGSSTSASPSVSSSAASGTVIFSVPLSSVLGGALSLFGFVVVTAMPFML